MQTLKVLFRHRNPYKLLRNKTVLFFWHRTLLGNTRYMREFWEPQLLRLDDYSHIQPEFKKRLSNNSSERWDVTKQKKVLCVSSEDLLLPISLPVRI
jgi:hypothetical protein